MNFSVKSLLLAAVVCLTSHSAIATSLKPHIQNYQINMEDAEISQSHSGGFIGGTVELDYTMNEVRLKLHDASICANSLCLAVSTTNEFSAQIVSQEQGGCGVTIIKAVKDKMPADGSLTEITVIDYSTMTCRIYIPYSIKTTLKTSYYDRIQGKIVEAQSSFTADQIIEKRSPFINSGTYVLSKGNYEGALNKITPVDGVLKIQTDSFVSTVDLSVENIMVCGPNEFCQIHPELEKISETLEIVDVQESLCGDRITAQTPSWVDSAVITKIVITDYSRAVCEIYMEHMLHVEYTKTSLNHDIPVELSKIKARFYFNPAMKKY